MIPVAASVDTHRDISAGLPSATSLDLSSLWSPHFPSADLVAAAGALLTPFRNGFSPVERRVTLWDGSEGPRSRLTIGPGVVAVGSRDRALAERSAQRLTDQRAVNVNLQVVESDLEGLLARTLAEVDSVSALASAGLVEWLELERVADRADQIERWITHRDDRDDKGGARCSVTLWSRKSRARMVRRLAEVDYAPLFAGGGVPAMLTLTYPGDWESVAPSAKVCKGHMDALAKRFLRAWGVPLLAVWKREFQHRGAPHYHLLMVPPTGSVGGLNFRSWIALAWAEIVDAHRCGVDPVGRKCCDFHAHVAAGTGVDYAEGMRAQDPKRLAVYFSKHGAYGAKEYQNVAPALWVEAGSVGRFWGVWGLDVVTVTVEVSPVEGLAAARTLRRWQNANGYRAQVTVWRTDTRTGAMRKRRSGRWSGSRMRGVLGFVVVNDGAAFGSQLARYLDQVRDQAQAVEVAAWLASRSRLLALDAR